MVHIFSGLGLIFLRIDLKGKRYGGLLTGCGGDFIIFEDPLKPDEALSETKRKAVNEWFLSSGTITPNVNRIIQFGAMFRF